MTEIKDGVFAQVAGTVGNVFDAKNGTAIVVEVKREGSQYPDRVTVWSVDFQANQGDRVAVKGWLSWSKSEKDGKTYVNVSLNKAQLVSREAVSTAPDAWSAPSDETPF